MIWPAKRCGWAMVASMPIMAATEWPTNTTGLVANSPMRPSHAAAEIDRYAVMPGQALSYMIGRLEIQRIRREAEERLGDRFQIKEFHDAVLDSGPLPLGILDDVVTARLT